MNCRNQAEIHCTVPKTVVLYLRVFKFCFEKPISAE